MRYHDKPSLVCMCIVLSKNRNSLQGCLLMEYLQRMDAIDRPPLYHKKPNSPKSIPSTTRPCRHIQHSSLPFMSLLALWSYRNCHLISFYHKKEFCQLVVTLNWYLEFGLSPKKRPSYRFTYENFTDENCIKDVMSRKYLLV